ncbi:MAG TPA: hypothetical protein VG456_13880 [Candidatus Sulfopaludibacter sp.]|jgi:hypothetical protein|nr:hypothetical protein [Candidatus Sulfopaludibacter sp.]
MQNGSTSWLWLAGAVGAAAGLAALAFKRKPRTRWEVARDRVVQNASSAQKTLRKQVKPWMGTAAGLAAGAATATYRIGKFYPRVRKMLA